MFSVLKFPITTVFQQYKISITHIIEFLGSMSFAFDRIYCLLFISEFYDDNIR